MHPDESSASSDPHVRGSSTPSLATSATTVDADDQTQLAKACSRGEYDKVKKWLSESPQDLNFPDYKGNTPLQIAALNGYDNIVKLLIDTGCDINCVNRDKDTPLLDAVHNGHLKVIKILLEAGVNPRKGNVKGEEPLDLVNDELENCKEIRARLIDARERQGDHQRTSEEQEDDSPRRSHAPVDDVVDNAGEIVWGSLFPLDLSRWPRLMLAERPGDLPTCKPQGYVLGRDSECDLVIDDPCVSNRHCLIYRVVRNGRTCVFLEDLSSNGTFVNENIVGCNTNRELKDRDEIAILDSVRFIFRPHSSIDRPFLAKYTLLEQLGKGHAGEVFLCAEKSTGERFAVKIYTSFPSIDHVSKDNMAAELNLMGLCHRNVMSMKEAFEEKNASFLVTQIAEKGELFNLIVKKSKLSEGETRHIFKQLFDAVKYLHDRNIVHRDLKPENILVLDEDHSVVLCSFDLSIIITTVSFDTTLCGTPSYVAPEVLASVENRKYGREVDIWSLGVILYICLCGFPPFSDELFSKEFPYTMSQQIKEAKFDYPSPYWDSVDDAALGLIDSMLVVDPGKRFTIEQCLAHPWLEQAAPGQDQSLESTPVLRRKPTMLSSSQVMPSPTYVASEAKGKDKVSSPLIKHTETTKQDHPVHQSVYDEPQQDTDNAKMVETIGHDMKELTLDKISSDPGGTAANIAPPLTLDDETGDSYDNSPSFIAHAFRSRPRGHGWLSHYSNDLFAAGPVAPPIDQSFVTRSDASETKEKPVQRRKSSNSNSPMARYSSVPGVASRSLDEPLPPIIVEDPSDTVSLKQAQKAAAARKSQEQEGVRFEELEEKVEESLKAMLSKALEKADTAVRLDNAQDFQGAWSAYRETCDRLRQVVLRTKRSEDKKKLEAMGETYAKRLKELSLLLPGKEEGGKTPPQVQESAAMAPQHSAELSDGLWDDDEGVGSEFEATPSARDRTGPAPLLFLEQNSFARLVNSAILKPMSPGIRSTQLPEELQNDIEFNDRGQESSSWTCTPSAHVTSDEIPLRVDGHPVVLPVEYKYPLTGIFSSPPDPHPLFISPSAQLTDEDIHHILSTFPGCIGFYLLVNGFLQIIMPDDFDYEDGIPSFPGEFGGLKVSLISESVCPTAGEASAPSPTTTTSTRTRFERVFGQSFAQSSASGSGGPSSANAHRISVGSTIRAIVPGSKSKQRFEGKTGVAIAPRDDNSKKYVTIPTHLLTDAVIASKTTSLDSDTWRKAVKVCVASNSVELGEVTAMFDEDPKSFPVGFSHDVSLVDISGIPDAPWRIPYATDLTWLSQQEWMDIKYNSNNLVLLDDRSREAKSIGVVDSRCQMVGQGIFRIQQQSRKRSSFLGSLSSGSSSSRAQDPRDDPSTWTSLVARSILYRVHPDYPARGGQSGVPVCVVSEGADEAAPRSVKVAGFASFVQMVSDVQKYDLEGDKLYKRLQEGRVAFYGAFQVPQELREGYQIL